MLARIHGHVHVQTAVVSEAARVLARGTIHGPSCFNRGRYFSVDLLASFARLLLLVPIIIGHAVLRMVFILGHRIAVRCCARSANLTKTLAAVLSLVAHHLLDLVVKSSLAIGLHHRHLLVVRPGVRVLGLLLQRVAPLGLRVLAADRARETFFALHGPRLHHFRLLLQLVDQLLLVLVDFFVHEVKLHLLILLVLCH